MLLLFEFFRCFWDFVFEVWFCLMFGGIGDRGEEIVGGLVWWVILVEIFEVFFG